MYMNTRSMPPARGPKRFFANAHKAHGVLGAPRFHLSPCHALAPVHRGDATRTRKHVPLRLLHRHCSGRGRAQTLSKPTWLGQVSRARLGDDAAHAAAHEPGVARGGGGVRARRRASAAAGRVEAGYLQPSVSFLLDANEPGPCAGPAVGRNDAEWSAEPGPSGRYWLVRPVRSRCPAMPTNSDQLP